MLRSLLPALLAATTLAVGAASAEPAPERVTIAVQVADLDLQSDADAQVALNRIRRAAHTICGETDSRQLARQAMIDSCVREAVNATVATSSSPALAALNGTPLRATTLAAAN
ncbi:UrcA family protein [Phenylobacterium sp. LjRoot219]|uniref:UrcA family protein n=1 Tax=Phenylobacterium sp. LjRoot219 TaxID=3342283 RepID=UPI003ECCCB0E